MTAKDPHYDRYAGIVSLPDAYGRMPRPFRVDEDGKVHYLDKERGTAQPIDASNERARAGIMDWDELDRKLDEGRGVTGRVRADNAIQLAETGNPNWNGYETMRAQGQRDGRALKGLKDQYYPPEDPNAPLPPASQTYPVPEGSSAWAGDARHRFILDRDGRLVEHPDYKRAFDGDKIDEIGVAKDLGAIALGTGWALKGVQMALRTAQAMVGTSAAKEGYELAKKHRTRKEPR